MDSVGAYRASHRSCEIISTSGMYDINLQAQLLRKNFQILIKFKAHNFLICQFNYYKKRIMRDSLFFLNFA